MTDHSNPIEEYRSRLDGRRDEVRSCQRLDQLVANLRLGAAIGFFATIWVAFGARALSGWWTLLPLAAFVALVVYHDRVYRMGRRANRAVAFYERGLARVEDEPGPETLALSSPMKLTSMQLISTFSAKVPCLNCCLLRELDRARGNWPIGSACRPLARKS